MPDATPVESAPFSTTGKYRWPLGEDPDPLKGYPQSEPLPGSRRVPEKVGASPRSQNNRSRSAAVRRDRKRRTEPLPASTRQIAFAEFWNDRSSTSRSFQKWRRCRSTRVVRTCGTEPADCTLRQWIYGDASGLALGGLASGHRLGLDRWRRPLHRLACDHHSPSNFRTLRDGRTPLPPGGFLALVQAIAAVVALLVALGRQSPYLNSLHCSRVLPTASGTWTANACFSCRSRKWTSHPTRTVSDGGAHDRRRGRRYPDLPRSRNRGSL